MVALLSMLSSLERLSLHFQSPQSRPDWERQSLPPPSYFVIPALNFFRFKGVTEYSEELVTRINTPQLNYMDINFFNQIDFDCRRLAQFINRTPKLRAPDGAQVRFFDTTARVDLLYQTPKFGLNRFLAFTISCREVNWQLSSIEQVCNFLLSLSMVEDLYIEHRYSKLVWKDDVIQNSLWLQLLRSFTAVKNLFLSKQFAPGIAAALQELVGSRITEVLPSLQNIFVEGLEPSGPFRENVEPFVAARQLSDYPIAVSDWDGNSNIKST